MDHDLQSSLDAIRRNNLYRRLRPVESPQAVQISIEGQTLANFSSNDYLGLAGHARLKEAALHAVETYGTGSGSARLISGSLKPHHDLEDALASFKGVQAALAFSSGYAAALGTIPALLGSDDVVVLDKLVHACLIDAARLSGARMRVFPHNDLERLESILKNETRRRAGGQNARRILIVTESIFSMDGDAARLKELADLKNRYGAWLMVDEAHATGLYGDKGQGLIAKLDLSSQVEIQMGTLGKALGAAGGFIAGSAALIDYLINKARTFIFSTALPPSVSASAIAGIGLVQSDEGSKLRDRLWENRRQIEAGETSASDADATPSAIRPWLVGEESVALELSRHLMRSGFYVPAIRYPTVAKGKSRLRITLSAAHKPSQIQALLKAIRSFPFPKP